MRTPIWLVGAQRSVAVVVADLREEPHSTLPRLCRLSFRGVETNGALNR